MAKNTTLEISDNSSFKSLEFVSCGTSTISTACRDRLSVRAYKRVQTDSFPVVLAALKELIHLLIDTVTYSLFRFGSISSHFIEHRTKVFVVDENHFPHMVAFWRAIALSVINVVA